MDLNKMQICNDALWKEKMCKDKATTLKVQQYQLNKDTANQKILNASLCRVLHVPTVQ
jgi:hypothetical protein